MAYADSQLSASNGMSIYKVRIRRVHRQPLETAAASHHWLILNCTRINAAQLMHGLQIVCHPFRGSTSDHFESRLASLKHYLLRYRNSSNGRGQDIRRSLIGKRCFELQSCCICNYSYGHRIRERNEEDFRSDRCQRRSCIRSFVCWLGLQPHCSLDLDVSALHFSLRSIFVLLKIEALLLPNE